RFAACSSFRSCACLLNAPIFPVSSSNLAIISACSSLPTVKYLSFNASSRRALVSCSMCGASVHIYHLSLYRFLYHRLDSLHSIRRTIVVDSHRLLLVSCLNHETQLHPSFADFALKPISYVVRDGTQCNTN